ncbi:MAG: ATP-binding protein [Eubacteriales bacterium]|nr:ATP-binding protein [Eubacteriales bacterium]
MSFVILEGLHKDQTFYEVNYGERTWGELIFCFALISILSGFVYRYGRKIELFFKWARQKKSVFLTAIVLENFIVVEIMSFSKDELDRQILGFNFAMLICTGLAVFSFLIYTQMQELRKENSILDMRHDVLEKQYVGLKKQYDLKNKQLHDRKYELQYLSECFTEKKYAEGADYIRKLQGEVMVQQKRQIWTGNGFADFLLDTAKEQMDRKGIKNLFDIAVQQIPIEISDFCILLGNLLDNAVEAAEQCAADQRWIRVELKNMNQMLTLIIENSYANEPILKNGRFLSSKKHPEGHGWGIENVKKIVEESGGWHTFEYKDKRFIATIALNE